MSDPVTNAEVEDVLSSIRRLVSEDKRPLQTDRAKQSNDRLVLTPSLRVSEEAEAEDLEAEFAEKNVPVPDDWDADSFEDSVDELLNEPQVDDKEAAPFDLDEDNPFDFIPAGRSDENQDVADENETVAEADAPFVLTTPALSSKSANVFSGQDNEPPNQADQNATQPSDLDAFASEAIHDDSAVNLRQDTAFVAEADVEETVAEDPWEEHHWDDEDAFSDADQGVQTEKTQQTGQDTPDSSEEPTLRGNVLSMSAASAALGASSGLSAKIAALETAIGNISDNFEPEASIEDAFSDTKRSAMRWEDTQEDTTAVNGRGIGSFSRSNKNAGEAFDDAIGYDAEEDMVESITQGVVEARIDAPGTDMDAIGDAFSTEEPMIDEEALRDLVSEIVRAELQGALGERITRNVRKLVRREIHRALTAQELE